MFIFAFPRLAAYSEGREWSLSTVGDLHVATVINIYSVRADQVNEGSGREDTKPETASFKKINKNKVVNSVCNMDD